jgi:hypothetical protein
MQAQAANVLSAPFCRRLPWASCPYFMMPADLVKRVVEACRWGAGGEAEAAAADGSY